MKLLFDTNAFLRWVDARLPDKIRRYIQKPNRQLLVSIVTPCEIAIKSNAVRNNPARRFRMPSASEVKESIERLGAQLLPVTLQHAEVLYDLPLHHQDPFDRMIIAQALEERCTVVTSDQQFSLYEGLQVLWD